MIDPLLNRLLEASDTKLRRLRRMEAAAARGDKESMVRLQIELYRTGQKDRSLGEILRVIALGKRPTMQQLDAVKSRLRFVPFVVQRLYAITRMSEILRALADIFFTAGSRPGDSAWGWSDLLRRSARCLDKQPPLFTQEQFVRCVTDSYHGDTDYSVDEWVSNLARGSEYDAASSTRVTTPQSDRRLAREFTALQQAYVGPLNPVMNGTAVGRWERVLQALDSVPARKDRQKIGLRSNEPGVNRSAMGHQAPVMLKRALRLKK